MFNPFLKGFLEERVHEKLYAYSPIIKDGLYKVLIKNQK